MYLYFLHVTIEPKIWFILLLIIKMKDREKLEQIDDSVKKTSSADWAKEDLAETLEKPIYSELSSDYLSWERSSSSKWSHRDTKFEYWKTRDDIVWAVLVDYSYYPGWWCWMEYWVKLFVKRWDKTDMKRIVYRDSYSSANDDWWKSYKRIDSIEITDDRVILTVSSSKRTDSYVFPLKKSDKSIKEKIWLSLEDQTKFKEMFEFEKKRLLDEHTRKEWKYPASYDLTLRQIPDYFGSHWVHPYDERQYDKAEIVDEYVDAERWTACIVIKTQIDANADSWKQFQWLKYEISLKWLKLVDRNQAYQSEMRAGKQVSMYAK